MQQIVELDREEDAIPGFDRTAAGKPLINLDERSLFAYADLIRRTESLILDLFGRGLLSGTTHTCLGQELCQLAVVRALNEPDDVVLSNHRNHGHFLTYSGDFVGLVAEIMGREAGVCAGYGGSQHIAYHGFHSNGVQAGMTAIGVGMAMARRLRSRSGVVAIIIGDGTLGEGLLYESFNLASVWRLPVLYVIENNGIAQTTYTSATTGGTIEGRGAAFGLKTWRVDDADHEFAQKVDQVVAEIRVAQCPGMLIIDTRRMGPHSKGDDLRDAAERHAIVSRDPLAALGALLPGEVVAEIEQRNKAFIERVEKAALASPESRFPRPPKHALRLNGRRLAEREPERAANVRTALNDALRHLLRNHQEVLLLGEDLHDPYGGAFKVTAGLSTEFPGRVISTPISEAGVTGAAIGLAISGYRPIVEIMFADFLTLCMDQIYNHAVKFPGMFAEMAVPMVIRTPCGGRRGYGPTHSQNPENLYVSVPGFTVLFGSHRHNVGQLLVDAVHAWPNPVLFLEHKLLYTDAQDPASYEDVPPSPADLGASLFPTVRSGSDEPDVTIVTFGGMVPVVERAAKRLSDEELAVEIVVPSLLSPLPRQTLLGILLNRPRIAVIEESHHEFGVSAELIASLAEAGFRGSVIRLGTAPVPIASARSLEREQLPDEEMIVARVLEML